MNLLQASGTPLSLASAVPPPETAAVARVIDGYKHFQVLRAGFRSGVFDWLRDHGPAERAAIAEATGLRGAHLGAFLQSLQDLGLLERDGLAYRLPAALADVLCANGDWYQGGVLDDLLDPACGWSDLHRFMGPDWRQAPTRFSTLARAPFLGEARRLAERLETSQALSQARTMLCFDGSNGLLAAALGQRFAHIDITVAVAPEAVADTTAALRALLPTAAARVVAGTPLTPPEGQRFDHVVVFHSQYPVRRSTDAALEQLASALNPGAGLCLAHWFCLEACETAPGGLRDLDKAVLTDSHPLCGIERFNQRLQQAGLAGAERHDLPGELGNTKLHFAYKSAA